jgi:hypothetical protein
MTPLVSLGLFIPVFLCLELVSAAPGRESTKDVVKRGLRNFGRHFVLLALGAAAFHYVTAFFLGRPPLW